MTTQTNVSAHYPRLSCAEHMKMRKEIHDYQCRAIPAIFFATLTTLIAATALLIGILLCVFTGGVNLIIEVVCPIIIPSFVTLVGVCLPLFLMARDWQRATTERYTVIAQNFYQELKDFCLNEENPCLDGVVDYIKKIAFADYNRIFASQVLSHTLRYLSTQKDKATVDLLIEEAVQQAKATIYAYSSGED